MELRTGKMVCSYLEEARRRQLAPKTVSGYSWALKKLTDAFPEALPSSPQTVLMFLGDQDLSPTSRHDIWRGLRTFWRWASERGLCENVMLDVPAPRVRATMPRTLTDEELARLIDGSLPLRELAMVSVPLDNGIRIGEMASLKRSRVREDSILVSGKTGDRVVPISANVRDLLLALSDGECIWTGRRGPLTQSGIQLAIRRVFYRAGIGPPKSGPHVLRHTFALRYILNGGDVFSLQRIMGHSDIQSTMIYVHMGAATSRRRQHAQFSPMAGVRLIADC